MDKIRGDRPSSQPHYRYTGLPKSAQRLISLVYFRTWWRFVRRAKLPPNQQQFFSTYFKEIHAYYYLSVVIGPLYVTNYRLKRNFLLSRANENLRIALQSFKPYNLTSFIHAVRSQIELNALLAKLLGDEEYLRKFLFLNEDRKKVGETETVTNINTLVRKLDGNPVEYQEIYDMLSLLLHPNPTAVRFYAQANKPGELHGSKLARPTIKTYFNETISITPESVEWFEAMTWNFLAFIEHFLIMFSLLRKDDLSVDAGPEELHQAMMSEIVKSHEREITAAANSARREGRNVQQAINEVIARIISDRVGR